MTISMRHLKSESLPRRQTDPLWIQDYSLSTGHNEATHNATATFVKRKGQYYMVTCRHVLDSVAEPDTAPEAGHPTMALQIDQTVLNFSYFVPKGIKPSVRAPVLELGSPEFDIALACIDVRRWQLLSCKKNKVAIDLDSWRGPNWKDVTYCLAVGYQNDGKKIISSDGAKLVTTPFLNVVAELSSTVSRETTVFSMSSELSSSHRYWLSGMSGGAVYAVEGSDQREVQDEELFPVGIVFEGFPSTEQAIERNNEEAASALFSQQDIFIRGVMLTPDTFDDWLIKSDIRLDVRITADW